jgi:3-methylfumaryl-CoA hydratase
LRNKGRVSLRDFIGNSERRTDTVWPILPRAMAATLNVQAPGEELPPLWHWGLFQEWAPGTTLGLDGHTRRGGFLPAEPTLPRRMWAGGRLRFVRALRIGDQVWRDSVITGIEEKAGSSGRLLFVNLRHTIGDRRGAALIEEQDLVYRELRAGTAPSVPSVPNASTSTATAAAVEGGARTEVVIDAPLLFRYSAVTGNSHRIHYDRDYASEEGYAGLVVHGPLQATLLAGFALQQRPAGTLAEFSFRGRDPALLHRCPLTLEAWRHGEAWRLHALDRDRIVCTTAEARFNP